MMSFHPFLLIRSCGEGRFNSLCQQTTEIPPNKPRPPSESTWAESMEGNYPSWPDQTSPALLGASDLQVDMPFKESQHIHSASSCPTLGSPSQIPESYKASWSYSWLLTLCSFLCDPTRGLSLLKQRDRGRDWTLFSDWRFERNKEKILQCNSSEGIYSWIVIWKGPRKCPV